MTTTPGTPGPIPVLLYHCVAPDPSAWIAPFTVSAATLRRHLEIITASGRTPITLSQLRDGIGGQAALPARPVVITFDDGFSDTLTIAAPLLGRAAIPATIYLTSGFLTRRSPGGDRMLDWAQTRELALQGHEIGAHSASHPQLDTLAPDTARQEIGSCKRQLEDTLGMRIRSFAYPHGYSSPRVRRQVAEAGYDSACAVKNALSSVTDPAFAVARLMLTPRTSDDTVRAWLVGSGARTRLGDERAATRASLPICRTRTFLSPTWSRR
jgi:Predicted xylanase/chitin deacetylase